MNDSRYCIPSIFGSGVKVSFHGGGVTRVGGSKIARVYMESYNPGVLEANAWSLST